LRVFQPAIVMANSKGKVNLVCKYNFSGKGEEFRVTLQRGPATSPSIICASSYTVSYSAFETKRMYSCNGQPSKDNVTLTVSGLTAADTDTYVCKIEIMYPPPYRSSTGDGTVILVPDTDVYAQFVNFIWILLGIITVLMFYCILITTVFCICRFWREGLASPQLKLKAEPLCSLSTQLEKFFVTVY
uniref:Cytotoxic T-lymphocyte associated protein 4 n=1 Tax=Latimeria chalumnae TaxID=7897 RepID=H3AKG1_LATCH